MVVMVITNKTRRDPTLYTLSRSLLALYDASILWRPVHPTLTSTSTASPSLDLLDQTPYRLPSLRSHPQPHPACYCTI